VNTGPARSAEKQRLVSTIMETTDSSPELPVNGEISSKALKTAEECYRQRRLTGVI